MFGQWLQAYEIEATALQTAVATLTSVFPAVTAYSLGGGDMLFIAQKRARPIDVDKLSAALLVEPVKTAANRIFLQPTAAALLADADGNDAFLRALAMGAPALNTDDLPLLELSFAKSVGRKSAVRSDDAMFALAVRRRETLPALSAPLAGLTMATALRDRERLWVVQPDPHYAGRSMELAWGASDLGAAAASMRDDLDSADDVDHDIVDHLIRAHLAAVVRGSAGLDGDALAELGQAGFATDVAFIRVEAAITDVGLADLVGVSDRGDLGQRARVFATLPGLVREAFAAARRDPWVSPVIFRSVLTRLPVAGMPFGVASAIAQDALSSPFAAKHGELARLDLAEKLHELRGRAPPAPWCTRIFEPLEPNPHWSEEWLAARAVCYAAYARDTRFPVAAAQLDEFREHQSLRLDELMPP